MIDSNKFVIGNIQTIKNDMETTWSGYASDELCTSLGTTIKAIAKVKLQLNNFDRALSLLEKYKEKKAEIDVYKGAIEDERANPSLLSTEEYLENGKKKIVTIFVVNQKLIDEYNGKIIILKQEKDEIKIKIEGILESFAPVNLQPKNNHDIAHRGNKFEDGKGNWSIKDNSIEAFINAGKNGFWGAEADIIQDANGNLVCSHNAVKKGENPPSFEEYLDVCREYGMTAIIDMKYSQGWSKSGEDEYVNQILDIIESKGMMDSCVIQTNNHHDIVNVRNNSESARIWYLTDNVTDNNIQFMKEQNVECVNTQNGEYAANRVVKLKENGIDSCVWAVQEQSTKDRLIKNGATYIMSDNVLGITPYQEGDEDYNDIVN
mgnify:CR=1 FL=1